MVVKDEMKLLGYPVFGGWLPFVGFRTFEVEEEVAKQFDGYPVALRGFVIEWFLRGWVVNPEFILQEVE